MLKLSRVWKCDFVLWLQCWLWENRSSVCHRLHLEPSEETGEIFLHVCVFFFSNDPCWRVSVYFFVLDDYSRFQYLRPCSEHENPAALSGSNQGIFFFLNASHGAKSSNKQNHISGSSLCQFLPPYQRAFDDLCVFRVCVFASCLEASTPNRAGFFFVVSPQEQYVLVYRTIKLLFQRYLQQAMDAHTCRDEVRKTQQLWQDFLWFTHICTQSTVT